jgi:C-terminal processing protease CtpA/Prc
MKKCFMALAFIMWTCQLLIALEQKKARMCQELDVIKQILEVKYAGHTWKKMHIQWDLQQALSHAKKEVIDTDSISIKQFQQILRRFLNTTQDHHVQAEFCSTEYAFLPFYVKSANHKYFISWVDEEALSENYAIEAGDELLEFDGRPVAEVIDEIKQQTGWESHSATLQSLAEMALTLRSGKRGDTVPQGSVTITVKSTKTGKVRTYQLMWDYFPEFIENPMDKWADHLTPFWASIKKEHEIKSLNMMSPLYELYAHPSKERRGELGALKSFLPNLGDRVWEPEDESLFDAYTYQDAQGRSIGYVRIPHYTGRIDDLKVLAQILNHFEQKTEALVIDQLHNPGGLVFYQYAIASMLSNRPLATPKHRLCLTHADILAAHKELDMLVCVRSDRDATKFFPNDPYMNYEYALFLKEFYRFIIQEWNAGRTFTNPTHLGGVDHLNPRIDSCYTKPILLLIDHMDFSCADFFPAILQDNKRATLFGSKTAGAGGCMSRCEFPNSHGIAKFSYIFSIAERGNSQPIENLGVTPDIAYQITEEDLKSGYLPYAAAVNRAMQDLLNTVEKK